MFWRISCVVYVDLLDKSTSYWVNVKIEYDKEIGQTFLLMVSLDGCQICVWESKYFWILSSVPNWDTLIIR